MSGWTRMIRYDLLAIRCGAGETWGDSMDSAYFSRLADRCIGAARRSFDLDAVTEFHKLAEEFARKAEELDRIDAPIVVAGKARRHRAASISKASA